MAIYSNKEIKETFKEYLKTNVAALPHQVVLVAYIIGNDPASIKYVNLKKNIGKQLGIEVIIRHYSKPTYSEVESMLDADIANNSITGIIIQLPLDQEFSKLLQKLPKEKDVDLLNSKNRSTSSLLPPTIQSSVLVINDILSPNNQIDKKVTDFSMFSDKTIVIIGQGKLVGKPATEFFEKNNNKILIIDIDTPVPKTIAKHGDIVLSGAGSPKLIDSTWLSDKVIVIDASTSDDNGQLIGDVDLDDTYTDFQTIVPSPGGIGPLTVLSLFYNLINLS